MRQRVGADAVVGDGDVGDLDAGGAAPGTEATGFVSATAVGGWLGVVDGA